MPLPNLRSPFSRLASLGFGVALFILIANTLGTEPSFHFIKRLGTNQVIIHFYTDPNRTYFLQYLDTLSCRTNTMLCNSNGVPKTNWSNLFTNIVLPFPWDYRVSDAATNNSRFYRLRVTP
jgi:hypothetical protein